MGSIFLSSIFYQEIVHGFMSLFHIFSLHRSPRTSGPNHPRLSAMGVLAGSQHKSGNALISPTEAKTPTHLRKGPRLGWRRLGEVFLYSSTQRASLVFFFKPHLFANLIFCEGYRLKHQAYCSKSLQMKTTILQFAFSLESRTKKSSP